MPWHRLVLEIPQVIENQHGKIQEQFEEFFRKSGAPADMAMFSGTVSDDRLGLYFTPVTSNAFLRVFAAEPCDRPSEDVGLAVGRSDALARFRQGKL